MSAHRSQEARMEDLLTDVRVKGNQNRMIRDRFHQMPEEDLVLGQSKSKSMKKDNRSRAILGRPCAGDAENIPLDRY